jgi:predicted metal-dependent hydrolase
MTGASVSFAGAVRVSRSARRHARIVVSPDGDVEIRVPESFTDAQLSRLLARRSEWITQQRVHFDRYRPREPRRTYVSGESVRYLGRQYRLKVLPAAQSSVRALGRRLQVLLPNPADTDLVRQLVVRWFSEKAKEQLLARVDRCLPVACRHRIEEPKIRLRVMKRRWGSCSPSGVIVLNPKLIQTSVECIDYVILHELCHLRYPYHSSPFYRLLDVVLPDWRLRKSRLDSIALPEW